MPGFNGTGPNGEGPMTGGARGRCVPSSIVGGGFFGAVRRAFGMGRGGNLGRGRGWRNCYRATGLTAAGGAGTTAPQDGDPEDLGALKKDAEFLSDRLADIKYRIAELEKKRPSEK